MQSATLVIEKPVIQEAARTMSFLPQCSDRGPEDAALITHQLQLDFKAFIIGFYGTHTTSESTHNNGI